MDISNPESPEVLGNGESESGLMKLTVAGDYVYGAADLNGLIIYDISDPANPTQKHGQGLDDLSQRHHHCGQ